MLERLRKIDIKTSLIILLIYYIILGGIFLILFYNSLNKRLANHEELLKVQKVNQMYSTVFSDLFFSSDLLNRYEKSKNSIDKNFYSKKISEIHQRTEYSLDSIRQETENEKELSFLRQSYYSYRKIQALTNQIINTLESTDLKNKQETLTIQFFKLRKINTEINLYYKQQLKLNNQNFNSIGDFFIFLVIVFAFSYALTGLLIMTIRLKIKNSIIAIETSFLNFLKGKKFKVHKKKIAIEFDGIVEKITKVDSYFELIKGSIINLSKNNYTTTEIEDKKDYLSLEIETLRKNLITTQKKIEQQQIEASQRDWVNSGLAKFNKILRIHSGQINELSTQLITALVKYLGTIQGGVFILEEKEESTLELTASYAFNRQKYLHKTVAFGEGLVGTAAIEKRTIYLTELPPDYLEITSGLGDTLPVALLIVPLIRDDKVLGVFEISSFKKLEKYEIEFVEKVSDLTALTINTEKINQKTVKLLSESQRKSDELATQEEEMRQNLEELRATQEEAKRKEKKILNILESINNGIGLITLNSEQKILKLNRKLLADLHLSISSFNAHKLHEIIEPADYKIDDIWEEAISQKVKSFYFSFAGISGFFMGILIPVFKTEDNEPFEMRLYVHIINDLKEKLLIFETEIKELNNQISETKTKNKKINQEIIKQKQVFENIFKEWKEHIIIGKNYKQKSIQLNQHIAEIKETNKKQKTGNFKGNKPDANYKNWLDDL